MRTWVFRDMEMRVEAGTWLYVAIQKDGPHEQIVGQTDSEHDIAFIPAFLSKDAAQQAMFHLHLEKKKKYELQAIIYDDLVRHATEEGFLIFVLDEEGNVMERLPAAP
jgi:spore cortex formation protein SpoVR/YcgB (stage V sporulation)